MGRTSTTSAAGETPPVMRDEGMTAGAISTVSGSWDSTGETALRRFLER
jgi:hypothetical protein